MTASYLIYKKVFLIVLATVILAAGIFSYLYVHDRNMQKVKAAAVNKNNSAITENLGGIFSITFPCNAKVTQDTNSTPQDSAWCDTMDKNANSLYEYDATDAIPDNNINFDYNYVCADAALNNDGTPHFQTIRGVTYNECGTYDSQNDLYMVTALGISPYHPGAMANLSVMQLEQLGSNNPQVLWAKLTNFLNSISFDN